MVSHKGILLSHPAYFLYRLLHRVLYNVGLAKGHGTNIQIWVQYVIGSFYQHLKLHLLAACVHPD